MGAPGEEQDPPWMEHPRCALPCSLCDGSVSWGGRGGQPAPQGAAGTDPAILLPLTLPQLVHPNRLESKMTVRRVGWASKHFGPGRVWVDVIAPP